MFWEVLSMKKTIWAWDGSVLKEIEIIKKAAPAKSEGLMAKIRCTFLDKVSNILANFIVLAMFIALTIVLYLVVTYILQATGYNTTKIVEFFDEIWQWVEFIIEKFSTIKKI